MGVTDPKTLDMRINESVHFAGDSPSSPEVVCTSYGLYMTITFLESRPPGLHKIVILEVSENQAKEFYFATSLESVMLIPGAFWTAQKTV